MQPRVKRWSFLWLDYERIGHVESLKLFGLTLYRRSGSLCELLGYEWIQER